MQQQRDDSVTPEQAAERLADRLVGILIRRFRERGLPMQPLGDELLCAGTAILADELGPAGAAECLRRAADAAEDQIAG